MELGVCLPDASRCRLSSSAGDASAKARQHRWGDAVPAIRSDGAWYCGADIPVCPRGRAQTGMSAPHWGATAGMYARSRALWLHRQFRPLDYSSPSASAPRKSLTICRRASASSLRPCISRAAAVLQRARMTSLRKAGSVAAQKRRISSSQVVISSSMRLALW